MSEENLEAVREIWSVFERSGFPAESFDPEVEWHTASDLPEHEVCRGTDAIQRMLVAGWENVSEPGLQAEELADAGDWVAVRWRGWGTGRASGVPIDWREAHIYRLRDGKVVEVREYRTWEAALSAVGLPPDRAGSDEDAAG